ncbi:MAG: DNA helicase UvrD [Candidatus Nanohaloarchaeota archaeon]|nr:DNA helicase UvrD [Candidatus Nanohaloarchaeota archaeon]
MRVIGDLHLHSKYSRATSPNMNLDMLAHWGKIKGLNLLGTGDFTHPAWFKELENKLKEKREGIYTYNDMDFILQTEVNNVFEHEGKRRQVHNIIYAKDFDTVKQINEIFAKHGNLAEDGRPSLKLSCQEMMDELKSIGLNKDVFVVPAHAWTPWFGIYGSKSGFNSIKECFGEHAKHVFAIETGLSSDPLMNGMVAETRNLALISNSDSHSYWPWRLGREANIFEFEKEPSFNDIFEKIKNKDLKTIEVDPSYGKYHFDGHRKCGISMDPAEAEKHGNRCPVCGKPLTLGVLHRVYDLGDIKDLQRNYHAQQYYKVVPLHDILAAYYNTSVNSKKVWKIYDDLIKHFGNEYNILLYAKPEELKQHISDEKLVNLILQNREGKIHVIPGYDGEYGKVSLNPQAEHKEKVIKQKKLF